jgi:endonuclease/exonuclease/phosphatase family metal-dependent hydrolase
MTENSTRFRIATYNIHKCRGFDRRTSPERIIEVIRELKADILCLQEVVNAPGGTGKFDQARKIAEALPGYNWSFGVTRPLRGGTYGNMTLTRFPLRSWQHFDVSRRRRERRGVLQTDIEINSGRTLHVFNVHFGTGFMERRYQGKRLVSDELLKRPELTEPRIVLGDFNEWSKGVTTELLQQNFKSFQPQHALRFPRTYPGMLPVMTLDHCYYEPPLELEDTRIWRTRKTLVASDHLPLIADFRFGADGK